MEVRDLSFKDSKFRHQSIEFSGFKDYISTFMVWVLGWSKDLEFKTSEFKVLDLEIQSRIQVAYIKFRVWRLRFRVYGLKIRGYGWWLFQSYEFEFLKIIYNLKITNL